MPRGKLIVIEGIDGVGKSTQAGYLADNLTKRLGLITVLTKEPGGTRLGLELRKLLFHNKEQHMATLAPGVRNLFYLADHLQHLKDIVTPALDLGQIVICDRWSPISDQAYGTIPGAVPAPAFIAKIMTHTLGEICPHLVIWLDMEPEDMDRRLKEREADPAAKKQDGKVWSSIDLQEKVRDQYSLLYQKSTDARFMRIAPPPTASALEVSELLYVEVCRRLGLPELARPIV